MPALLNIAVNLVFGGAMAWVLRRSAALRDDALGWPYLALLAFEALVFTPIATYLFRFYPQWSMLYWFDPQVFPELDRWLGALSAMAIAMNFVAASLGYFAVRASVLRDARWLAYAPFVIAAVIAVWVFSVYGRRVAFMGDYDEFWQGHAKLLVMRIAGWVGLALYGFTACFVWWLRARFADHDPEFI